MSDIGTPFRGSPIDSAVTVNLHGNGREESAVGEKVPLRIGGHPTEMGVDSACGPYWARGTCQVSIVPPSSGLSIVKLPCSFSADVVGCPVQVHRSPIREWAIPRPSSTTRSWHWPSFTLIVTEAWVAWACRPMLVIASRMVARRCSQTISGTAVSTGPSNVAGTPNPTTGFSSSRRARTLSRTPWRRVRPSRARRCWSGPGGWFHPRPRSSFVSRSEMPEAEALPAKLWRESPMAKSLWMTVSCRSRARRSRSS